MRALIVSILLLLILLAGGCATTPSPAPGDEASEPAAVQPAEMEADEAKDRETPMADREPVPPDVLFNVMAGEIAGQHEDYVAAAHHYLEAARGSADPAIAERATQIALYAGANDLAQQAVTRLLELTPDSARGHTTAVNLAMHRDDADLARRHLRRLLELADGSGEAWRQIARLLTRSPDREFALARMRELVDRHESEPAAWLALSQLASHFERLPEALEAADRALALDGDWAEGLAWRGRLRISDADYEGAVDDLRRAISESPEASDVRLHLAEALRRLERFDEAQELLAGMPQEPGLIQTRASLAVEAEDWELAESLFRKLLDDPEFAPRARYFLGHVAEMQDRFEAALDWYARVDDELRLDARLRTAAVLAEQDKLDEALEQLAALREEGGESAEEAWLAEARLLADAGRVESAFEAYDRGMDSVEDVSRLRYARALLAAEHGRVSLAEADLRQLLEQDPDDAQALNALGYTLAEQTDRYQEALELITRALELAPGDAAVVDSMGWVQYRLGQNEKALEHLRRALKLQFDPEIAAHLGEVLWVMGRRDEAREVWRRALDRRPEDGDIVRRTMERLTP